jgi:hypothetical protein
MMAEGWAKNTKDAPFLNACRHCCLIAKVLGRKTVNMKQLE